VFSHDVGRIGGHPHHFEVEAGLEVYVVKARRSGALAMPIPVVLQDRGALPSRAFRECTRLATFGKSGRLGAEAGFISNKTRGRRSFNPSAIFFLVGLGAEKDNFIGVLFVVGG